MISSLFWDITQQSRLLFADILGQRVGPIFKGHTVHSWTTGPLKMGPIGCPEVSQTNCQSAMCNVTEDVDLIYTMTEA
jgi:hypothetical protein